MTPIHEIVAPATMAVAVDIVLIAQRDDGLGLLLIRRRSEPFRGRWALPGGFVREDESLEAAALRELEHDAGVTAVHLEPLGAYGDPDRDPRRRVVSIAFVALVPADTHGLTASTDAAWFPLSSPPRLAFDHTRIVKDARTHLRNALDREPVGFRLLPKAFTLGDLQRVHEAILGQALDKRNFRRKVLSDGLVETLEGETSEGMHRPAQLYRYLKPAHERTR